MKFALSLIILLLSGWANAAVDTTVDMGRLVQLIDYIGVDYPAAVQDGRIVSKAEYEEMQEFAATVVAQAGELRGDSVDLLPQAKQLQALIHQRANVAEIAAVTSALRRVMLTNFDLAVVPRSKPDLIRARSLYMENCAACHGESGQGNGPLARGMQPAPTDFVNISRYRERNLFGLYSTIGMGVEGTAMQSYADRLAENDRWALAFYVGQLAVSPAEREQGATLWKTADNAQAFSDLKTVTTLTPNEATLRHGSDGAALMGFLRSTPEVLFGKEAPLSFARKRIAQSVRAYAAGQQDLAYRHALAAYLDGFELIEHSIETADHQLKDDVEAAMTNYRELVKRGADAGQVRQQADEIYALLDSSVATLDKSTLSESAAFGGALIILLREGLEALLVVAALAAFLVKTGRRDGLVYLHIGWIGALLLGGLTWLASQYLVEFSGATREITEGVAALLAMVVLFWVGFWLHSKTSARQWQRFIEGSLQKALSTGTLWAIAALSFIAVYREVFETILFYQAMWVQAQDGVRISLLTGMGTAAGILVLLAWVILRYSVRLPLRQFFSITSVFMFVLAIIFAGKGVAALQEAGKLPMDPIHFPRVDILGIYPNIEGLGLQLALLILAVMVVFGYRRKQMAVNNG